MNHLRAFLSVPLLALIVASGLASGAASGCAKPNDLPRLEEEALVMAKGYQQRFDDLARRVDAIAPGRLRTTEVQKVYEEAKSTIERFRNDVRQVPVQTQAGVKNGNPDDLRKFIDDRRERFEGGVIEATAELGAVESWLGTAEQRQNASQPPPAPPTPEPDTEAPAPVAPGSDAPAR